MEISRRLQANCSEWNEEVEDENNEPILDLQVQLAILQARKKAKEVKEWD